MPGQSAFWDDLLEYIDDRRVIPIIGDELLRISTAGTDVSWAQYMAPRLAEKLGLVLDQTDLATDAVNTVIGQHLAHGGRPQEVNQAIRGILGGAAIATPAPLRQLARIRHFNLFVTTTFDTFMENALNEERFAGAKKTDSLAFSPNDVQDLPCAAKNLDRPTVYHLLGRISATPNYALTEEDRLEFLYSLPNGKKRPEILFDELRENHLLLIGNRFPDWLARFFIRLAKGSRLGSRRDNFETIADGLMQNDKPLVLFLKNFSYGTQIYPGTGAVEFVNELTGRYLARHAQAAEPAVAAPAPAEADAAPPMPDGAVFLSYASEDRIAAQSIRDALEAKGVDVWYDRNCLLAGDHFDLVIKKNIQKCSLFIPLLSAAANARTEGYFRQEWQQAVERSARIAEGIQFILPVALDNTDVLTALVPAQFNNAQWTFLPGGAMAPEFAVRVIQLVRDFRARQQRRPA
jgi:hypothetical protein